MASDANLLDDEIDIRELVYALFRYKWIILGITLVAAVATLIFSKFGQPRRYTAQAQVLITKPLYTTNLDTRIQTVSQTPDPGVLKDLALADDLLLDVYTSPEVTAVLDKGPSFDHFKAGMSAKLAGTSKLVLSASASKPETAKAIANTWADQFVLRINSLYSTNEKALTNIKNETHIANLIWDAAEQKLLNNLPNAIVDTKKIILDHKKKALDTYLNTLTQLDLIISDANSLRSRLTDLSDDRQLSIEYQLSLIGLYQRASGGLAGVQVQLPEPTTIEVQTVLEAKVSLKALVDSLDTQKVELQVSAKQLEPEITAATVELETANYQLTQLTTDRDLALSAYQALSAQSVETQIDFDREDLTAKVASQAVPPQQPISNRTLMKTIIAGGLAFVLSCFGVLFINWWRSPAQAKPVGE